MLTKIHQHLEPEISVDNKSGIENAVLFCAFVYIIVSAYVIYIVPGEELVKDSNKGDMHLSHF